MGSDTTERLHFHFSLSRTGEGNGSPLQCSCLENPRDGGAWWAAVYGVTQSRTRLKRLSSSSQNSNSGSRTSRLFTECYNYSVRKRSSSLLKLSYLTKKKIYIELYFEVIFLIRNCNCETKVSFVFKCFRF